MPDRFRLRANGVIVALMVLTVLVGSSGAFAGSGGLTSATTLDFVAGSGENNHITVAVSGASLRLTDTAVVPTLTPTAVVLGCTLLASTISCPKAGVTSVTVETGNGADQVAIDPTVGTSSSVTAIIVDGGAGADAITNSSTVPTTASYAGAPGGVTVDLGSGSATGDGADTLTGVTNVIGSAFDDTLIGNASANRLNAGGGDDLLIGRAGNDLLDGGSGSNTADYSLAAASVAVNIAAGVADPDGDGGSDTFIDIENANAPRTTTP